MRGLVLGSTTQRVPLLQATALVLVSGRNDSGSDGASGNESALQPTSTNDHEVDSNTVVNLSSPLDTRSVNNGPIGPETSSGSDTGTPSFPRVTSLVNPDVSSMVTAQVAARSGSKRTHSDADGELHVKKSRCNTPQDLWNSLYVALTSEDRTLEDMFAALEGCNDEDPTKYSAQAEAANMVQQHVGQASAAFMDNSDPLSVSSEALSPVPKHGEDWFTVWLDELDTLPAGKAVVPDSDEAKREVMDPQVASFAEASNLLFESISWDATTPALEQIPAPMESAETNAAQQLTEVPDFLEVVSSAPNQEDQPMPRSITRALKPPISPVPETPPENPVAVDPVHSDISASHSEHDGTSTSLLEFSCDEGNIPELTPESSASTPRELNVQVLIWARPPAGESAIKRSRRALKEGRSASYEAALKLLLSSDVAQGIRRLRYERTKTQRPSGMANAPYLSSSWLLERLVLQNIVPAYVDELQTAFECYGYDNVRIPDLSRRVLDLAYTLKQMDEESAVIPLHWRLQRIRPTLAAEIVRDAFFRGRPLRPGFKTYLRNKLKVKTIGKLQLPFVRGHLREEKGNMARLNVEIRMIKRAINPRASWISHPLNFISFLSDVSSLVRSAHSHPRATKKSTKRKKRRKVTKTRLLKKDFDEVEGIVTKYRKLFKIDLAAEVEALLEVAPDEKGPDLLNSAVEEGYVPFDLLQNNLVEVCDIYNFNAHCLLGSLTALYRRLFEYTNDTTEAKTSDSEISSDVEASDVDASDSDACNEGSKLDVVQAYLLQPLPTEDQGSKLTVKEFDPLSVASKAVELWKQDLLLFPSLPNWLRIPDEVVPFIRSHAPFGSAHWILAQLVAQKSGTEHQWRRDEFHYALDMCGYACMSSKVVFARAYVLAKAILTKREVPFNGADELLELPKDSQAYFLAADIIQAALFHTWPQRRDLTSYSATQLRYEVLPEHMECLRKVMAEREKRHPCMEIRSQKGGKEVVVDWVRIQSAKNLSLEGIVDNAHPLSFDRFWKDVTLLNKGNHPAAPAVASKYRILFDRDIVEDLNSIREQSPQICYSDSFLEGIEEGYVPYRYAQLLAMSRSRTMLVNSNGLLLLGALVNYYVSLVDPANAIMSQETSTITPSQENPVTKTLPIRRRCRSKSRAPESKEQMAKLMAILREAPQQKLLEAPPQKPLIAGIATKLHPVAQYLLGHS